MGFIFNPIYFYYRVSKPYIIMYKLYIICNYAHSEMNNISIWNLSLDFLFIEICFCRKSSISLIIVEFYLVITFI